MKKMVEMVMVRAYDKKGNIRERILVKKENSEKAIAEISAIVEKNKKYGWTLEVINDTYEVEDKRPADVWIEKER